MRSLYVLLIQSTPQDIRLGCSIASLVNPSLRMSMGSGSRKGWAQYWNDMQLKGCIGTSPSTTCSQW